MTETYDQIKQQRDEARAACAKMREVIRFQGELIVAWRSSAGVTEPNDDAELAKSALSSDCGKDLLAELERKTKAIRLALDWATESGEHGSVSELAEAVVPALEEALNPQTK